MCVLFELQELACTYMNGNDNESCKNVIACQLNAIKKFTNWSTDKMLLNLFSDDGIYNFLDVSFW